MGYDCIRIDRARSGFNVTVTDPDIVKANQRRDRNSGASLGPWQDPQIEYSFEDKAAVLKFLDKAIDVALPEDAFTSAFDKLAKEAGGTQE